MARDGPRLVRVTCGERATESAATARLLAARDALVALLSTGLVACVGVVALSLWDIRSRL